LEAEVGLDWVEGEVYLCDCFAADGFGGILRFEVLCTLAAL